MMTLLHVDQFPRRLPFMLLPGAVLFPNAILPLYIFERKYQEMLRVCLDGGRLFGVGLVRGDVERVRSRDDFHHVAGIGLIRACVGHPDGTSSLVLQGLARVRMLGFDFSGPYFQAEIEEVPTEPGQPDAVRRAERALLDLCAGLERSGISLPPQLTSYIPGKSEPGQLADHLAAGFPGDAAWKQQILEETDVARRLALAATMVRSWDPISLGGNSDG